jgi:HK97 gp10 family phage protein
VSYVEINGAALAELFTSADGEVAKDLQRRALQVERAAKGLCPVDTGRLRSSINNEIGQDGEGLVAIIGTNVEYAPYVELGTSRMEPQAFLLPALEAGAG